jgi:F0F1-type ATP synthase membrane subunit c/vacuolar-type H+-ATPase subunit K
MARQKKAMTTQQIIILVLVATFILISFVVFMNIKEKILG